MSNLYIRITRPEGYEDIHPDLILQDMNIDPVWGAEVVDVEAVLRECREVIEEAQTYCEGPQWSPSMAHDCGTAIAKIDEVLNEDS